MILRYFILALLYISTLQVGVAQLNVTLESNTTMPGNARSADIWGYVDTSGLEYAVIGVNNGFRIYSLEDPTDPMLRAFIPGDATDWRDMKSYGNYIYGVQDVSGNDGLAIIDMSGAPTNITHTFWSPTLTVDGVTADLEQCHNLYITDDGYGLLVGTNIASGGVIILDLFTTPGTPIHIGESDPRYAHDVYARGDFMYTSEIYAGDVAIYDISDPTAPTFVANQETGRAFTHNAWLSDDGNTVFTTDERSNAYTESYDISDVNDIKRLDRYRPLATQGTGVIPHNVHVLDDYLVISHYTEGVVVVDAAQPDNLIRVGQYDTYTGSQTGFRGCWGAYPFLPSGLLLASDINSGLYVLDPTYVRACYLRGMVRDINTNATITGVDVEIVSTDLNEATTDNFGEFATGIVTAGNYDVIFSHPSYPSKTVNVNLATGETVNLTVFLGNYTGPCPTVKVLNGILPTKAEFASIGISSNGTIQAGTAVEMHANELISLENEFQVDLGGELYVDNNGCN